MNIVGYPWNDLNFEGRRQYWRTWKSAEHGDYQLRSSPNVNVESVIDYEGDNMMKGFREVVDEVGLYWNYAWEWWLNWLENDKRRRMLKTL